MLSSSALCVCECVCTKQELSCRFVATFTQCYWDSWESVECENERREGASLLTLWIFASALRVLLLVAGWLWVGGEVWWLVAHL